MNRARSDGIRPDWLKGHFAGVVVEVDCAPPAGGAQSRTQTTVLTRLRLRESPWTTRTGLRKPGPDPVGSGRFAQYTWPWAITIQRLQVCALTPRQWRDPGGYPPPRRLDSSPRSRLWDRDARCIRLRLPCRLGFATFLTGGTGAQLPCKLYREWRSQFSCPKYNQRGDDAQTNAARAHKVIK